MIYWVKQKIISQLQITNKQKNEHIGWIWIASRGQLSVKSYLAFFRTPRLLSYLIIPILVNIFFGTILYAGLLFFGWQWQQELITSFADWLNNYIANLPSWLSFLSYVALGTSFLVQGLLIVVILLLTGFLLVQFGTLLGAPWYGKLSEELEKLRLGNTVAIEVGIVEDIGRAILFEVKKLVLMALVGLPLFLLNFLPGIGPVASTIGSITLGAIIVCLDFLDSPLERRRLPFRTKLKIVFRTFPASAGFSLVCLGLISLPLLNLITIPLCVASGTLFCCDRVLTGILPQLNESSDGRGINILR